MAEDLKFSIGFDEIKTDNIDKLWKAKEKEIQNIIDKTSKLQLKIDDLAVEKLNKQLKVTDALLKSISMEQTITRTKPATLLQATKAQAVADKAAITNAATRSLMEDKLAVSAMKRATAEASATTVTNKQTAAWKAQKGILNGMPQMINSYLSILGAARLFSNIKSITSEFELQRVSLAAITRDAEFAEQLFNRIKLTAIASPFTTKELVTYTKQLAAYRIENEQLFDVMNQLADISAGLGVSMDRLVLAYGQVRAASVLRGTELRQFTEAGIPLVDLLAKKFSQLRGEVVSTGDVFELISERAVPFEMIKEIFEDMTKAGGTFYQMQKKQAESLYGVWANVPDNIQLAFDKLGRENRGVLIGLGKGITELFQNFDLVINGVQKLAIALVTYKMVGIAAAASTGAFTAATIVQTAAQKGLNAAIARGILAIKGFSLAIKNIPLIGWVITGISALVGVISMLTLKTRQANEESIKNINNLTAQSIETKRLTDGLIALSKEQEGLTNREKELNSIRNKTKEQEKELGGILKRTSEILSERGNLMAKLRDISPTFANSIQDITNNTKELKEAIEKYNQELRIRLSLEQALAGSKVVKDALKYNESIENRTKREAELNATQGETIQLVENILKNNQKILDERKKEFSLFDKRKTLSKEEINLYKEFLSSTEDYPKRISDLSNGLSRIASKGIGLGDAFNSAAKNIGYNLFVNYENSINKSDEALKKFKLSFTGVLKELQGHADLSKKISLLENTSISQEDRDKLRNEIIDFFTKVLDDKGIIGEIRPHAEKMIEEVFSFSLQKVPIPIKFTGWKKILEESGQYQETVIKDFSSVTAAAKDVVNQYNNTSDEIKVYNRLTKIGGEVGEEASKKVQNLTAKQNALLQVLKKLNLTYLLSKESAKTEDPYKAQLDTLKSAYKEYQDLQKMMSSQKAKAQIKAIYGFEIDDKLYREGLEKIQKTYLKIKKKSEAAKIGNLIFEFDANQVENKIKMEFDNIKAMIERESKSKNFFDKILGLTGDVGMSKNLTKKITGVEVDGDIREQMINNLSSVLSGLNIDVPADIILDGKVDTDKLDKILKDPNLSKENKRILQESLNDLVEYDKSIVIQLLETAQDYEDIEKQKAVIIYNNNELIRRARELDLENLDEYIAAVKKKTQQELIALDLGEHKKEIAKGIETLSDTQINDLLKDLESFDSSKMNLKNLRELTDLIEKLREEKFNRNYSFLKIFNMSSDLKKYIRLKKELNDAEKDVNDAYREREELLRKIKDITGIDAGTEKGKNALDDLIKLFNKGNNGMGGNGFSDMLSNLGNNLDKANSKASNAQTKFQGISQAMSQFKGSDKTKLIVDFYVQRVDEAIRATQLLTDEVLALKESLGEDTKYSKLGSFMTTMSELNKYTKASWDSYKNKDYAGAAANAIASWLSVYKNINKWHDKRFAKQQEEEEKRVKRLGYAYDDLSRAMDRSLGDDKLKYFQDANKSLEQQKRSLQNIISLEKQKKDTDDEQVLEWERQIVELNNKIEDSISEMHSYFLGSSLTSAAESFAESWLDAYLSFEDTKKELETSFRDMLKNLIVKSVLAKTMEKALQGVFDATTGYIEGKLGLDDILKEIDMVLAQVPALDEMLKTLYERLGLNLQELGSVSGLSLGISQASEDSINAVAGAVNTAIYYLALIHEKMIKQEENIVSLNTLIGIQNAALVELKAINDNTLRSARANESIYEILESSTKDGSITKFNVNM